MTGTFCFARALCLCVIYTLTRADPACPPSQIFCHRLNTCIEEARCITGTESSGKCGYRQVFCSRLDKCVPDRTLGYSSNPFSKVKCSEGEEPCPLVHGCVPRGCCLQISPRSSSDVEEWNTILPRRCAKGTRYCSGTDECVATTEPCGTPPLCADGLAYCPQAGLCKPPGDCLSIQPPGFTGYGAQDQCDEDEYFCQLTWRCQSELENCGAVCEPSHVICPGSSTICRSYHDCNSRDTGLAWTIPYPYWIGSTQLASQEPVILNNLAKSDSLEALLATGNTPRFRVILADVGWSSFDSQSSQLLPINISGELTFNSSVQFLPSDDSLVPGIKILKLTQDADSVTQLTYSVVQYILPSWDRSLEVHSGSFATSSGAPVDLNLRDLVSARSNHSQLHLDLLARALDNSLLDRNTTAYRLALDTSLSAVTVEIRFSVPIRKRSEVPGRLFYSVGEGSDVRWQEHLLEIRPLRLKLPLNSTEPALNIQQLRFIANDMAAGNVTLRVRASLGESISDETELIFNVVKHNSAPVLRGDAFRPSRLLLNPGDIRVTAPVSKLISRRFKDADGDRLGVAVVGGSYSAAHAQWDFSTDSGVSWQPVTIPETVPCTDTDSALSWQLVTIDCYNTSQSVTPLYLNADHLLRFTVTNDSLADPEDGNFLLLAGWDLKTTLKMITAPDCFPDCGGNTSLSRDWLRVTASWTDCSGQPVTAQHFTTAVSSVDVCGVCGGDGSSCLDCYGDINGSAYMECGECVGGATALDPDTRDCALQCGLNSIVQINGQDVCVPISARLQPTELPCDNVTGSDAVFNSCGVCVLGTTGLDSTHRTGGCGACASSRVTGVTGNMAPGAGTSGNVNYAAVNLAYDECGQCLTPGGPNWNECSYLLAASPRVVDLAMYSSGVDSTPVLLRPRDPSHELWDLASARCSLVNGDVSHKISTDAVKPMNTGPHITKPVPSKNVKVSKSEPQRVGSRRSAIIEHSASKHGDFPGSFHGQIPQGLFSGNLPAAALVASLPVAKATSLPFGEYRLDCAVTGNPPSETTTSHVTSAASLLLVDSSDVRLVDVRPTQIVLAKNIVLTASVTSDPLPWADLWLGLTASVTDDSRRRRPITSVRMSRIVDPSESDRVTLRVRLEQPMLTTSGLYRVAVAYSREYLDRILSRPCQSSNCSALDLIVRAEAPSIVAAGFEPPYRHLFVEFDRKILPVKQPCSSFLHQLSSDVIADSECRVAGRRLLITPGDTMTVPGFNLTLHLSEDSGIVDRTSAGGEYAATARGSFSVDLSQAAMTSPELTLSGPSVVCGSSDYSTDGGRTDFQAVTTQGLGRPLTISWNITLQAGGATRLPQSTVLTVWAGINDAIGSAETKTSSFVSLYSLDTSKLVAGNYRYQVFAEANSWLGGRRVIRSVAFTVRIDGASVDIRGPTVLPPIGVAVYRARFKLCGDTQRNRQTAGLQYTWRLMGAPSASLDGIDGATLRVDSGLLPLQSVFNLTCYVFDANTGASAFGSMILTLSSMASQPLTVSLAYKRRSTASSQPLYLSSSVSPTLSPGRLSTSYSWSCRMAQSQAGCFVGDSGKGQQRLEQRLGLDALTGPSLLVPANLLKPSLSYVFNVTVEMNGLSDSTSTLVYVAPHEVPRLRIFAKNSNFAPTEDIHIPAQVTSTRPVSVRWESDSPLPVALQSALERTRVQLPANSSYRPVDLVLSSISSDGLNCIVCGSDVTFRLVAESSLNSEEIYSVETSVYILDAMPRLSLQQSRAENGMVRMDASSGWGNPPTLVLNFEFGFVESEGSMVAMETISGSSPVAEILVASNAQDLYVKACSPTLRCSVLKSSVPSGTSSPIASPSFEQMVSKVLPSIAGRSSVESAGWILALLNSVSNWSDSRDNSTTVSALLQELTRILTDVSDRTLDKLNSGSLDGEFGRLLTGELIRLSSVAAASALLTDDLSILQQIISIQHSLTLALSQTPVLNSAISRRKRSSPSLIDGSISSAKSRLTYEEIMTRLTTSERVHAALNSTESAGGLLESIESTPALLCALVSAVTAAPLRVDTAHVLVQVSRVYLPELASTERVGAWSLLFANSSEFLQARLQPSPLWARWSRPCGLDPEASGQPIACRDACLAAYVIRSTEQQEDLLTLSSDVIVIDPPNIFSSVYHIGLIDPGSLNSIMTDEQLDQPYALTIQLSQATANIPSTKTLQCRRWSDDGWTGSGVETGSVSPDSIVCRSRYMGHVAVFIIDVALPIQASPIPVVSVSVVMTTSQPSQRPEYRERNITLVIDGDFNTLVGDRRDDFERSMRSQIARSLNISQDQITRLTVRPGSVIVDFALQVPVVTLDGRSQADIDPLAVLEQLVASGQLQLMDLDGNVLVVPRDALRDVTADPLHRARSDQLAVIIACVIAAVLLVVMVTVILVVVIKNKKRVKTGSQTFPLDRNQQNSTYKSFQFEEVMDGTAGSLEKYKSSRVSDETDLYLSESLRANRGQLKSQTSIPDAAHYSTPTRDQLEATQPMPDSVPMDESGV